LVVTFANHCILYFSPPSKRYKNPRNFVCFFSNDIQDSKVIHAPTKNKLTTYPLNLP
jgi:hypothetical protein